MSYDNWKTRLPDELSPQPPPCETKPRLDADDVCEWCGARPEQACQWYKP